MEISIESDVMVIHRIYKLEYISFKPLLDSGI